MLNILKSDFYKLIKSRAFWVCIVLCMAFAVFMVTAMHVGISSGHFGNGGGGPGGMTLEELIENISATWALLAYLDMGLHLIFIAVFVSIFVSSEFHFGTMKNVLSRGASRINVFLSKIIVCSFASVIILLAFVLAMLVSGTFAWGYDPNGIATLNEMISMVALQGLMVLGYAALFTFISMSIRGTGGAIAANVILVMMAAYLFGAISMLFGGSINLGDYWLEWGVSNLAEYSPATEYIIQGIIIAFVWGIASIVAGLTFFKKQDVK